MCPSVHLNNKHLAQYDDVKYLGIHLDRKLTWRTHNYKEKTAGSQTAQTVLDHWPKIAVITGKQTDSVQRNPETYLDLWCTTVGISI